MYVKVLKDSNVRQYCVVNVKTKSSTFCGVGRFGASSQPYSKVRPYRSNYGFVNEYHVEVINFFHD